MKNASLYLSVLTLSAALVACSGGNSGAVTGGGERCKTDGTAFDPIPFDNNKAEKISMKPGDKKLSDGQYVYAGTELYYYDSATKTQVYLSEDANFKNKVNCMRNLSDSTKNEVEVIPIASDLSVKGNVMDFKVRNLMFTFTNKKITMITEDAKKGDFKTAEEVFASKGSRIQFYKTSDNGYEMRTTQSLGTVRKDIVVRYTFKK